MMNVKKSLQEILTELRIHDEFKENIVHLADARGEEKRHNCFLPDNHHPLLNNALKRKRD